MVVSINGGVGCYFGVYRAPLKGFGVDIRQVWSWSLVEMAVSIDWRSHFGVPIKGILLFWDHSRCP